MICIDCGVDTEAIQEYFHVHDEVWQIATLKDDVPPLRVLCIGCLENRIGRKLKSKDFTNARVNRLGVHSERLKNRLATN